MEVQPKFLWSDRFGLRHKAFGTQHLPGAGIIDVLDGVTGRNQSETKSSVKELVRTFKCICPSALDSITLTRGIRRCANLLQFCNRPGITCCSCLPEQRIVTNRIIPGAVANLSRTYVRIKKIWPAPRHQNAKN